MGKVSVTFLPTNQTVEGNTGASILEIAIAHGVPLMHACGGFCACTTCHVKVKEGAQSLSAPEEEEIDRMETEPGFDPQVSRLGCQTKVMSGAVTVEIQNLDE